MARALVSVPAEAAPVVTIDGRTLRLDDVAAVAYGAHVELAPAVREGIERSLALKRDLIERGVPLYGITTGFGDSVRRQIAPDRADALQLHLIRMLGAGTGPAASEAAARAVTLLRANSLVRGHSGVRYELVERLVDLLNAGIAPVIPEEGSVGASGDLVPLSYIAAALIGTREVYHHGRVRPAADALREAGFEPLTLESKEGLALVNGTAFMTGIGALAAHDARRIAAVADICTAMCVEVLCGITGPFDVFVHDVAKPHPGSVRSARRIRSFLAGSKLARGYEEVVQDAGTLARGVRELEVSIQDQYSLRCAPHFIGVLWDALDWIERWLEIEINSTNDNPLFDAENGRVLSGGNFAGGHLAFAMDALKTAVASLADLMDRQLELIVDEKFNHGLTANLIARVPSGDDREGIEHGFKGMQIACSSLAADALSRCMPLTAFSRSTECHNQDKVSMGATAARAARDVVALTEKVAAIHVIALCQAADLRGPSKLGRTREVYDAVRRVVPFGETDREFADDIASVVAMIRSGRFESFSITDTV
jgi:histidine ammonia-lyase/phenylalanine ammonia-lyase